MSTPVITIFVRHTDGCKYAADEFSRRCKCRKHLRWTAHGKQFRRQAGTRSWEEAEEVKRYWTDQLSGKVEAVKPEGARTVQDCVELFLADKAIQDVSVSMFGKYKLELRRFITYLSSVGVFSIKLVTREVLTGYCTGWPLVYPSAGTRYAVRGRLVVFLRFCHACSWIDRVPKAPPMKEQESTTRPLEPEEFARLLMAVSSVPMNDEKDRARFRGLILLQRWSGLAIHDALLLPKSELLLRDGVYRVVTTRQKTGTDISVPIPTDIAVELLRVPNEHNDYFFWDGKRDALRFAKSMSHRVSKCFAHAGLADGNHMKSHRLRDTFAVELLQRGVPLEEVSKLLGHTSIETTEKHYAKWVKGRQERLDRLVIATWATPAVQETEQPTIN